MKRMAGRLNWGTVFIAASIIASPFIYDAVKSYQREVRQEKRAQVAHIKEFNDITAIEIAANYYKKENGHCPMNTREMVGIALTREIRDRRGLTYRTSGNCKFQSSSGITAKDDPFTN